MLMIALDLPLDQGLRLERRLFQQLFATQDQKEGQSCQNVAVLKVADNRHGSFQREAKAHLVRQVDNG